MARINYKLEWDGEVHAGPGNGVDYTLCGLSLDGDSKSIGAVHATNLQIGCPDCVRIIQYCKGIRFSEIKPERRAKREG